MAQEISLVGECPDCGTNLDNGGNWRCPTCAAEPVLVQVLENDRDILIVIIDADDHDDADVIRYLKARWPDRYPIFTSEGYLWHRSQPTGLVSGRLVILDLNMGG